MQLFGSYMAAIAAILAKGSNQLITFEITEAQYATRVDLIEHTFTERAEYQAILPELYQHIAANGDHTLFTITSGDAILGNIWVWTNRHGYTSRCYI